MAYALYKVSNPKGKKKSRVATLLHNLGARSKAAAVAFAKKQKNPTVLVKHSGKGSIPVRIAVKTNPDAELVKKWEVKGIRFAIYLTTRGGYNLYVNGTSRTVKSTLRGAEGYAKRIAAAN